MQHLTCHTRFAIACCIALALMLSHLQADEPQISATFSIVAVDPESGTCGAAVASKYPAVGKVVPYVRAGVGAFCTQHWHEPKWGEEALDLLAEGKRPEAVFVELLTDDPRSEQRQLAIIDMQGRTAQHHPAAAGETSRYWGGQSGRSYACQGNTLTSREVIDAMAKAYEETEGSLADRLMASLVAGDQAGGDHRGRLAAGIRVCKKDVEGYWFEMHVDRSDDAVLELATKYSETNHDAKGAWKGIPAASDSPNANPKPEAEPKSKQSSPQHNDPQSPGNK